MVECPFCKEIHAEIFKVKCHDVCNSLGKSLSPEYICLFKYICIYMKEKMEKNVNNS